MSDQRGFTLAEILVVMAIIMMLSGFMVRNFARGRVDLDQARAVVMEALRETQSLALAGAQFQSTLRCGYGIRLEETGYTLYAGPVASTDCATHDRSYNAGTDPIVRSATFPAGTVELVGGTIDIFFEPPDPVMYVCSGGTCDAATSTTAVVRRVGAACTAANPSADCRAISIATSGLITAQ